MIHCRARWTWGAELPSATREEQVCELARHGAGQDFAIYAPELVELKVCASAFPALRVGSKSEPESEFFILGGMRAHHLCFLARLK